MKVRINKAAQHNGVKGCDNDTCAQPFKPTSKPQLILEFDYATKVTQNQYTKDYQIQRKGYSHTIVMRP